MNSLRRMAFVAAAFWAVLGDGARAEVIIQYFETRWDEMYQRLPEIAEAGYESIWTPPPGKSPIGGPFPYAYGGNVGYNSFDRFDLGDQPQRGNWETRYGSRTALRNLVDNAHQSDIKIYPDIVFNHTGNGPDFRTYPGMVPQDFHVFTDASQPGGFRRADRMWQWDPANGTGGTLHQELVSLMDIVLEFDNRFQIGGANSVGYAADPAPFVRHPGDSEKYPYFNSTGYVTENSRDFVVRWINWLGYAMDYDGVRLDAPKHVYKDFFGLPNQDQSLRDRTLIYNIQKNFNERRGLSDANPFDDMYSNDLRRDDAMVYSEFFVSSVGEVDYWRNPADRNWGIQTRYLDFPRKKGIMNDAFNSGNLGALSGMTAFSPEEGVMFAHSHDEGPPGKLELAYAYILTRVGVPVVYFSGNNLAQSQIGRVPGKNTWMEKGYDYALGDTVNGFQTGEIPNLIYVHNQFARGKEWTRWSEGDYFAYERYDDLNSNSSPDSGEGLMIVALNDSGWDQTRSGIQTSFSPGTKLKDYTGRNGDTVTVDGGGRVTIRVPGGSGQGWVCYAPFNAEPPAATDPLQFSGAGVGTMPWVIPAGRDGAAKPVRNIVRLTGDTVQVDVRYSNTNPQQNGETVDNVLLKWGQGRDINSNGVIDNNTKSVVTGGFENMTKITDGNYRMTATITNVPEGLHVIKARAFNGRTGKPALFQTWTESVYVDRRGPDLAFENLSEGETIHGARVITINNPDRTLYNLTYTIDGGAQQQADEVIKGKWRINLSGLSAGNHTITLSGTETDMSAARNVIRTSTLARNFTVDTAGSSIAINHPSNGTINEPFFKTIVTVPAGTSANNVKLYWNGYEQILTETSAGSGVFESIFDGRYVTGGVQKQFTGAFINGANFFEAVVNAGTGNENRVSRRVSFNLFGQNLHDSDGDGVPDEIELPGFLDGTNPGPDVQWSGDNSKDLIPNFGESWSRLNAMAADTDYNGSLDGNIDSDGDGTTNLQEVIKGFRLSGNPYAYNIYNGSSVPPASIGSYAASSLAISGGQKLVTITYRPNDGVLSGASEVTINITPTGAGSPQSVAMTGGPTEFTYTYTVPSGATSISYTFTNGATTDTSGGASWSASTSAAFVMDGLFDSQNFIVADSGMRVYAAIRGNKLYTATWSPKGGINDHMIYITDQFGDPVPVGAATSIDIAANYASWTNSSNLGSGFGPWSISTSGSDASAFLGDPTAAGISGMNPKSFGLRARSGSVTASRPFTSSLAVGDSIAFQWAINWDGGNGANGKKGFNIWAGSTFLMNVENVDTADITVGGSSSGIGYGTQVMDWTITRTASNTLQVRATGRDGNAFSRNLTVSAAAPTRIDFYAENLASGAQRQPYINNLRIYRGGIPVKNGRVYGDFNGTAGSKPWIFSTPDAATAYGFKASGRSALGNAGQAVESEVDLVEVFGAVPKTIFIAAASYSTGYGGTMQAQGPATYGNSANDLEIPEYQPLATASIRDEDLDGRFDVGNPEMIVAVNGNETDGNYGLRRFYLDEVANEASELTVKFKPNAGSASVSNVEVFTNLNRRDFAVLEEDPSTVTTSSNTYFRAYAMSGPDGSGYYTATLPVNLCGAYRLQVRYKIAGVNGGNYIYYTDNGLRRDCAVVVSPKKALQVNIYEVNPLIIEAKDTTFSGRSTFRDLIETGGFDGRPDALNQSHYASMGINMLWLQPIHPIGVESRDTDPDTSQPFDPGSPYAVRDYWSVSPNMGRGAGTNAGVAMTEFQDFVTQLDQWGVGVMMDGTFNHSAPDAILGQGAVDLGISGNGAQMIRDFNPGWYAREGFPSLPATGTNNIAMAPDRNNFVNWNDVREIYFGDYDALVKEKGPQNSDKSYPDNAYKLSFLLERDEFTGFTNNAIRQVWNYFAYYPIYWLDKTGMTAGTPKAESYKGIDGLRCDFAQGLPSQFWEYTINKTRSRKWDFVFMAETLDGYREVAGSKRHGVSYRSARHFDVLNENIVFYWRDTFFGYPAIGGAGTPGNPKTSDTKKAYDDREAAFDNIVLLNNLTSHDEVFPHNDVWSIAYAYAQVGSLDGIPMIMYGQEAGAQNSKSFYAASEGNFGAINASNNFSKYELNYGKTIPNFKAYNHMAPVWNNRTSDELKLQTFYGRVNKARTNAPALQSQNVAYLEKKQAGGGMDTNIFAVGKVSNLGQTAGAPGQSVVFAFANNNYRANTNVAATFDLNAYAPGTAQNYFGIQRGRTYNVKDLLADNSTSFVWPTNRTGADLIDNGLYVGLPNTNGVTGRYQAQYLQLIDVSAPVAVSGAISNNLANGSYAITNQVTFSWNAVGADGEGIVPFYQVNISTNGVLATNVITGSNSLTYTAPNADTKVDITVRAVNPNDTNSASSATAPYSAYLLTANGDYNGNGTNNAADISNGLNPTDNSAPAAVFINEVQSTNTGLPDQHGQLLDWVELHNPGGSSFNLSGYYLSDSLSNKLKYQFPNGTTIPAGGYLVVWCGNSTDGPVTGPYNAGQIRTTAFAISSGGEPIVLSAPGGTTIIDQFVSLAIGTSGTPAVGRSLGRGTGVSFDTLYFYTSPTQGTVNNTSGTEAIPLASPVFSVDGGIYTNSQTITVSTGETNAVIRYTLDGSDPTESSPIYSNGLTLTSAGNTNTTNSWIPSNNSGLSGDPYYDVWTAPNGSVARINVLRARVFKTGKAPSRITTKSYLIDSQGTNRYAFPVVSIATTPANLFSDATGIYVQGTNTYATNVVPTNYWANYYQSGSGWERPSSIEFYERNGTRLLQGEIGLRLNGNTTRQRPRKALRIYNRNSSGGNTWTNTQLFPGKNVLSWDTFLLRAGGNDWNQALFRDALVSEISSGTGLDRQHSRPVVVFLSGEYWGIHNLRDRIDEPWFFHHYGLTEPNYSLLEVVNGGADDFLSPGDYSRPIYDHGNTNGLADFMEIYNTAATNGYASAAGYTNLAARIDLDNFADYHAVTIWAGNTDWPGNNMLMWRSMVTNNANPRNDGKWRYIIKDNDFALGVNLPYVPGYDADVSVMARHDTLAFATSPTETAWANNTNGTLMLRKTLDNPIFRTNFINRFADLLNSTLSTNNTLAELQTYADLYGPGITEHSNRWPTPLSWTNDGVGRVRSYLTARTDAVRRHVANKFGLPVADLTVNVNNSAQGTVTVNRLNINAATEGLTNTNTPYPWTGSYFQSNALTVTAVPAPGYRFVSWTDAQDVTVGSDSTPNYDGAGEPAWTNGSSAGTGFGGWSFSEAGTANDGFFVGSSGRAIHSASADGRSFGIFAHSGGWARAARLFTNNLQTNQTFSFKISPGGFTAGSSKGVDFGSAATNRFSFYASDASGAPAYYFRNDSTTVRVDDSALFSANTNHTFDVSLTRLSGNAFRLVVSRGGQYFRTNFTATGPVDRAGFFNYYSANGNDTNNLFFNNLVLTDPGTVSNGGVTTDTNVAPSVTLGQGSRTLIANFESLGASGLAVQLPAVGAAGTPLSGVQVRATNSAGDADGAFTNSVVLTVSGNNGVTLYYTNSAVAGVAAFANVNVPSGATYAFSASSGALVSGAATNLAVGDGAVYLPTNNNVWNTVTNWDIGVVPNSTTARAIIPANTATNRTITNDTSVALASLTFSNGSSAFANTIAGPAGNSLTFQAVNTNAVITVTGSGTGNAELNLTGPVVLNSDLVIDVQSTNSANQEYGAMRLRGTNWSGAGGVIKRGPGMAGFTQAGKVISGNILVEQGVLTFSEPSISSLLSTNITVQSGGQLRLSSAFTATNVPRTNNIKGVLNLAGSGRTGVGTNENLGILGALRLETGTTGTTSLLTNTVNLTASADIHAPAGNTIQLNGPLTASSNNVILTKSGGGALTLGTNVGGFTGGITVNRGTLRLAGATFTNTTNAIVLTNDTTLVASGQWGGALQVGSNSALIFELGAIPAGTGLLRAASATFSGSNTVTLMVPTNAVPGTYPLLSVTGSVSGFSNVSLASAVTNFAWSQLVLSNNTIFALLATNAPTLPTAWHNPAATENLLSPPDTMRSPAYDLTGGTNLTIYAAFRRLNNPGYGTAELSAGQLHYRAATNAGWSSAALTLHANSGDHQIWKADLPAGSVSASTEYYIRLAFESDVASPVYIHDNSANNTSALTVTEATAQAQPFALRKATTTLGNLVQAFNGAARSVLASTAPTNLTINLTYNGSALAPTNPGLYTVIGTVSDAIFQGSVTNNFVIIGVLPVDDSVTRPTNGKPVQIAFSTLLANDARVASNGSVLTNSGLSIVSVSSAALTNVWLTNGTHVYFRAVTNTPEFFTYSVTDGTSTNTATVTVTPTNWVAPPFTLQVVGIGTAVFDGTNTRMTNDFIGVPGQFYAIEYKGEMSDPSWSSAGSISSGVSGSFSVPFIKTGNSAADWNGSMFFRGYRTNQ